MKSLSEYTLAISSGGSSVRVTFDDGDLCQKVISHEFMKKYIPGLDFKKKKEHDAEIFFVAGKVSFDFENFPKIVIGSLGLSERDIISLIELVFERTRQEKGVYCIHSASVIYKDKSVIFWGGASGMGKTRMARLFVDIGARFFSDEKTLIDSSEMTVTGGIPFQYLAKNFWSDKVDMSGDKYLAAESVVTKVTPIGLFVYGFGIDGAKFSVDKWTPEKFAWHLYEELGRKVRAISRTVANGSVSVPSIDSQTNGDRRISNVNYISRSIPCYSIQGSPKEIVEYIKDNLM